MTDADYTGQLLDGKYLLSKKMGEGGMGVVYAGQHVTTGRMVAVKILHSQLISNEELVHRFIREAQAEVAINHKNVIDVLDLGGLPTGEPFMVMEYLTGAGLDEIISTRGHLDLPTACAVMEPTLHAIGAAHEKGVVHRDLKPENVFINLTEAGDVEIKLIDFGISKIQNQDVTKLTQEGTTMGTPAYMSPEQVRGATETNHLTDIYAAGIIFYEMLCGDTPFEGQHYAALLANVLTAEPRHPRKINKKFPMEAWPVIQKAISKDATERYQSADEMLLAVLGLSDEIKRAKGLATLPAAIVQATGNKSMPPRYDVGQNHDESPKDANRILSDLAQQNSEMAAQTILRENAAPNDPSVVSDATRETVSVGADTLIGRLKKATIRRTHKTTAGTMDSRPMPSGTIEKTPEKHRRKGMGGITAFVIIVGIAALAYGVFKHYESEKKKGDSRVSIEIVGAPKRARIYYNDAPVTQNPFKVDKGKKWTPVRVVTGDRTRMRFVVIPSRDMRIQYVPGGRKAELVEAKSMETGGANPETASSPRTKRSQPSGSKNNDGVSTPAGSGANAHVVKDVVKDTPKPAAKSFTQSTQATSPAKKSTSAVRTSTQKRGTAKKTAKSGPAKKSANKKKSGNKSKKTTQKKKKPAKPGAKKKPSGSGKKRKNPFKRLEKRLKRTFGD